MESNSLAAFIRVNLFVPLVVTSMRSPGNPTPIYFVLVDLRHIDHIAFGINEKRLNTTCKPSQVIMGLGACCPIQLTRSCSKGSHCVHVKGSMITMLLESLITRIDVKGCHNSSPPHKLLVTPRLNPNTIKS